ncbi:MAG: hypothetical protein NTU44_07860, partial [Bacteroidetes bacterium]|nr:hypothetical protein [Bacteroidota bacterium]
MRLEFPVPEDTKPFQLISLENRGVIILYQAKTGDQKSDFKWVFNLYDVNLKQQWTREFPLGSEFEPKFTTRSGDTLVMGFQDTGKKGSEKKTCLLVIHTSTGVIQSIEEDIPDHTLITTGRLLSGYIILGMRNKEDQSSVMLYQTGTGLKQIIRPEENNRTYLEDILPSVRPKGFSLVYENFTGKKESVFSMKTYDFSGQSLTQVTLDLRPDQKTLNTIKVVSLDSDRMLVLGAYSIDKAKTFGETQNKAEESTGFFSGIIKDQVLISKNFYNFLDFKNFYNRLRGNQAIYEGKNTRKEKEISSDYRLLLHNILKQGKEYVFLAEAYYPEYHTITNWTYDYYGHMQPVYYDVFDGYRYNNAFVTGFDTTGKLLWENSLEMNNILSFELKQRVNPILDGDEIILAYSFDGKITSKVIRKDQTIDGIEHAPIDNTDAHDRVLDEPESNMVYWYNNFLLAYGYQEIKNVTRQENRRNVFYINK